jgi:hypothetical protein
MAPKFETGGTSIDMQPNSDGVWVDPNDISIPRVPFVRAKAVATPRAVPFLDRMTNNHPLRFVGGMGLAGYAGILAITAIPGMHPSAAASHVKPLSLVGSHSVRHFDTPAPETFYSKGPLEAPKSNLQQPVERHHRAAKPAKKSGFTKT